MDTYGQPMSMSFGDHSPVMDTLIPWVRDEPPESLEDWKGWELCPEAAGLLGHRRWARYPYGQTVGVPGG